MDRRGPLALALLAGLAGCSHHKAAVTGGPPPQPAAKAPAADTPGLAAKGAKPHRPESWTAYANYAAQEAAAPERSPADAQRIRDTARRAYQEALRVDPNYVAAHQGLARLYVAMGDQQHAAAAYQKALQIAPKEAGLWYELGMSHARVKAWGPAAENLSQAVELDPENRAYVNALGFALARAGRYEEGLACLSRYNGEAKGHYHLARMLEHVKQPELCKAHLRMALEKDADLEEARQMLARLEAKPAPAAPQGGAVQTVGYREVVPAPPAAAPAAPKEAVPEVRPA
jgi:tetratricopeptide (TPR) repeat protein